MSYASSMHDRMLAALVIPCRVVGIDLAAARVRVSDGACWTSAWVRWHSHAAGKGPPLACAEPERAGRTAQPQR